MRQIEKDISIIPSSLMLPDRNNFPAGIPQPPKTTHKRRMEVIDAGNYIDEAKYNDRYKSKDIKYSLSRIYKNKCAFCEQRVEQSHVEHYRPKKKYYWLAFSWDNLLLACATCNFHKGQNFEIRGQDITFINSPANIQLIHSSSSNYDISQQPMMINPETTDPLHKIRFIKNGMIESDDDAFAYTIEKCKIDRSDLNDQRRALLNTFKNDIISVLLENVDKNDQKIGIETIISKFVRDSKNIDSPFIAFKRYTISEKWLNEMIKEIN